MGAAPFTPTSPRRRRRKGEITAERILDAGESLFAERGYDGTTLRDVATAVGIRIPSLYNHFESKDALYAAVLERGIGPLMSRLSIYVEDGADPKRDSAELIEQMMQLLAQRPNLPRLVQHETLTGGQRLTPMLRDFIAPVFAKAHEAVEANPAAERWTHEQIPLLVLAVYHIVVGYFTIAPLYKEIAGTDLMSRQLRTQQTRFLTQLMDALFDAPKAADAQKSAPSGG